MTLLRVLVAALGLEIAGAGTALAQQLPPYLWATQAYQPLTSGTPLVFANGDDGATSLAIGFPFTYFGVAYDMINVGVNGVIDFAASCVPGGVCVDPNESCDGTNHCTRSFFSTTVPAMGQPFPYVGQFTPILSPWWDDLIIDLGVSSIQQALLGTAPNRELVVEWTSIGHFPTNPAGAHFNFQIHLFESSNVIKIAFGPFETGNDLSSWSGALGQQDAQAVLGQDFLACSAVAQLCSSTVAVSLDGQQLTVGVPNAPDLTGAVFPPTGANPGDAIQVGLKAQNIGLQPTGVGFVTTVYISSTPGMINPMTDTRLGQVSFPAMGAQSSRTATLSTTLPAMLTPGYYTVGAVFDSGNAVMDPLRGDNTVIASYRLLVGADLSAGFAAAPEPLSPGRVQPVSFNILNYGVAEPAVQWKLFLSADAVLDAGDTLLASGTARVPARPSTTITTTASVPAVPPGTYYLIASIDPNSLIHDIDRTNNIVTSPSFYIGAELAVQITAIPALTGPGAAMPVTLQIQDLGSDVPALNYELFLSMTPMLDATAVRVHSATIAVPTSSTAVVHPAPVLAMNFQPGNYYVIAVLDPFQHVPQVDHLSDIAVSVNTVVVIGPDLKSADPMGALVAFRGQPYRILGQITNQGGADAPGWNYGLYFANHPLITVAARQLGQWGPNDLAPAQTLSVDQTVTVPMDLPIGSYYLGIIADCTSQLIQQNPQDNIAHMAQAVIVRDVAPSFQVSDLTVPANGAAGETMVVQRSIDNIGNAPGTINYLVYLSASPRLDPASATVVATGTVTVDPAASALGADRFLVPADTAPGSYYVIYSLDPFQRVDVLDRSNDIQPSAQPVNIESAGLVIVTTSLPVGTTGLPYTADLLAHGGTGAYRWSIAAGALPAGLSLDTMAGRIAGTPTAESSSDVTIAVSDGTLTVSTKFRMLVSAPTTPLVVVTQAFPPAFAGRPYDYPLTAIGGIPPYSWSFSDGSLPLGLSLSPTGDLSGTASVAASVILTFHVMDSSGHTAESPLALTVLSGAEAVHFGPDALDDGIVEQPYQSMLKAVSGRTPYAFSVASGMLPPGLSISADTLSGTPSKVGSFGFELRVTDANGDFDLNHYVVTIRPDRGVSFVTKSLPPARVGKDYLSESGLAVRLKAVSVTATTGAILFALVGNGMLPPGIQLEMDGRLHGTPSKAGVFPFSVMVTDGAAETDVRAFGIVVDPMPSTSSTATTAKSKGCGCDSTGEGSGGAGSALALLLAALLLFGLARSSAAGRGVRRAVLLLTTAVALFSTTARAQTMPAPYVISQSTTPYVARNGQIINWIGTPDFGAAPVSLPFPFHFFGDSYSSLTASTQGFITFGPDAMTFNHTGFPDPSTPNELIAFWWDQLTIPNLSMSVEGTEPERVVILQFQNISISMGNGGTFEAQVWLFEGAAGRFEIHYGPNQNFSMFDFADGSLGFEDPAGTTGYQFTQCTPDCPISTLLSLPNTVFTAYMDAGVVLVAANVMAPGHVFPAVPFSVQSLIVSEHADPIGPFLYSLYLTHPGDSLGQPVFTSTPITLQPFEARTVSSSVVLPLGTQPGRYLVSIQLDPNQQLMEVDRSGNIASTADAVVVDSPAPDFTVDSVTFDGANVAPGGMLTAHVRLRNAGNLDGSTPWVLVLSSNDVVSASDLVLNTATVSLTLLSSMDVTVQAQIPDSVPPGSYWLGAIVNPSASVSELNYLNDTAVATSPLIVSSTLVLSTTALPNAYIGTDYLARLAASGGNGIYVFSTNDPLPLGLSLDADSGVLSGKSGALGMSMLTFNVTSGGATASAMLTIDVLPIQAGLTIVTRNLLPGVVGEAYPLSAPGATLPEMQHVLAIGGSGTATITFAATSSVPGLVLDSDGFLHGTPGVAGVFQLGVTASDGTMTTSRAISLTVVQPGRLALIGGVLPDALAGEIYSTQLEPLGTIPGSSLSFALAQGAKLPDGLSLTSAGIVAGTPTKLGSASFSVEVTEGTGSSPAKASGNYQITVKSGSGFSFSPTSLADATIGQEYQVELQAHDGMPPFAWKVIAPLPLPAGLTTEVILLDDGSTKLRFRGTPTALPLAPDGTSTGGAVAVLVTCTDAAGRFAQQAMVLHVLEPPSMTHTATVTPTKKGGGCGCATGDGGARPDASALLALLMLGLGFRLRTRSRTSV
jgi:MYXO-CTERM domain-containing protein